MGIRDQVSINSMFSEIRVHPRFWTCSIALYLVTPRVLKVDHNPDTFNYISTYYNISFFESDRHLHKYSTKDIGTTSTFYRHLISNTFTFSSQDDCMLHNAP